MSSILPWLAGAILLFLTGSMVYIDHLHGRVDRLTLERNVAIADREAADRAILELAVERAATDRRNGVVSIAMQEIAASPATDDAPWAPVLERALRAADKIGGIK